MNKVKIKCIDNWETLGRLGVGKIYEGFKSGSGYLVEGIWYEGNRFCLITEEEPQSVWDFITYSVDIPRHTAKALVFSYLFSERTLEIIKEHNIPLAIASETFRKFDEFNGVTTK